MKLAWRLSLTVNGRSGIGGDGANPTGPFTRSKWAFIATVGVLMMIFGSKGTPPVAVFGHGESGETLLSFIWSRGVTVKRVPIPTPGLAMILCGVRVTGSSRLLPGTGAVGPSILTLFTNCWGVTFLVGLGAGAGAAGGVGEGGVGGAAGTGAAGGVAIMTRISWRWASVVTYSLITCSHAFELSTARRSLSSRALAAVWIEPLKAGYCAEETGAV